MDASVLDHHFRRRLELPKYHGVANGSETLRPPAIGYSRSIFFFFLWSFQLFQSLVTWPGVDSITIHEIADKSFPVNELPPRLNLSFSYARFGLVFSFKN